MKKLGAISGAALLCFGFWGAVYSALQSSEISKKPEVHCTEESIPYETIRQPNNELEATATAEGVVTQGEDGKSRVCTRDDGTVISSTVIEQPVSEVIEYGTKAPEPEPIHEPVRVSSGGRTGAECNDGTYSSATGRGACSHHGGVAVWLYD